MKSETFSQPTPVVFIFTFLAFLLTAPALLGLQVYFSLTSNPSTDIRIVQTLIVVLTPVALVLLGTIIQPMPWRWLTLALGVFVFGIYYVTLSVLMPMMDFIGMG